MGFVDGMERILSDIGFFLALVVFILISALAFYGVIRVYFYCVDKGVEIYIIWEYYCAEY